MDLRANYLDVPPRALGIAAVYALIICIVAAIILQASLSSVGSETVEALSHLATYRAEIAQRPELESELGVMRRQVSSSPGIIMDRSAALAAARLDGEVKSLTEANGGVVHSSQILPKRKAQGFDVIAIEYDLTVPESRLKDLAYAVETHTPYLLIDDARILATSQDPSNGTQPRDQPLEVQWTVRGYRWTGRR